MSSQDKAIDRALKAALKRKFDGFETESGKASEEVIFNKLKPALWQFRQEKVLLATGFVIFLVTCSFLYFSIFEIEKKPLAIALTKGLGNGAAKIQPARIKVDSPVIHAVPLKNKSNLMQLPRYGTKAKLSDIFTTTNTFANSNVPLTKAFSQSEIIGTNADSEQNFLKLNEVAEAGMGTFVKMAGGDQNALNRENLGPYSTVAQRVLPMNYDNLEILDKRPMTYNLVSPVKIVFNRDTVKNDGSVIYKRSKGFAFSINILPLSPLQMLTVRPLPGVMYQNISVPSELSLRQLGYKFTGGMKKGDFAFLFSYSQLNQSFNYEIASEEFELKRTSKDYVFTPVGIPYSQNNRLKFIGLGIKRHRVAKNVSVFRGYFGDIGLEFSRELTTKTNLLWSNLAIGKQVIISRNSLLTIGPYVEYSFTKMVNPETKFQIRPYQIGISIGLTISDLQND